MNPSFILLALFATVFTNQPQFPENSLYGTWKQEQKISENLSYVGLTTYKPDGTFIALVDKRQNNGIDEKIEIHGNWNINKTLFSAIGKQKSGDSITDFSVLCEIIALTESEFTYRFSDGQILTETKVID